MATRDIVKGEELLVYYGDAYASELGINNTQFSPISLLEYDLQDGVETSGENEFKCKEEG